MNISGLANMQLQMGQLSQPASGSTASGLMAPAAKRVTQELESTNVKLSAFGQIKSAFGSAQTAADSLTATTNDKTATSADIEKAAQAFVAAYNQAAQSVAGATNASSSPKAALATDSRARAAGNDLARSLTSGNGLADLKQAGITRNKDGTLTLDTKALQSALQSNPAETRNALASAGQQVSSAAGKELASTGNLGLSVDKLSSRAKTLTAQQTSLQQQAATLQSRLDKQEAALSYSAAKSLALYQSILG